MSPHSRAVFFIGAFLPLFLTAVVTIGSAIGFFYMYKTFQERSQVYKLTQKYRELLQIMEPDAQFLTAEIPQLNSLYNMEEFLSHLQTAVEGDPRIQLIDADEVVTVQTNGLDTVGRVLKMEGLSGPIILSLGESLKKYPPIFTDNWTIKLTPDKNSLAFQITASLAPRKPSNPL